MRKVSGSNKEFSIHKGALYVVATPIGNLGDISSRALDVLGAVDKIVAEDTRHTRHLLSSFGLNVPLVSLHDHNERAVHTSLIQDLKEGVTIALVSDAGTPLISDPGYRFVRSAREAEIVVVPVPGPSALTAALSVAGLPTDRFVFEGFLSAKRVARRKQLSHLSEEQRTLIFYVSTHKIVESLQDMVECFGAQREMVVARELTKMFETVSKGSAEELLLLVQSDANQQKGEFVVLVRGAEDVVSQDGDPETQRILSILSSELPLKQASALAASITGEKRNVLYELALRLQKTDGNQ